MKAVIRSTVLLAFAAAVGCEQQPARVAVHPVSGQVTYNGKPAAGVRVCLLPTSAPTYPDVPANPHGVTGADGRFTLSTYGDGDGAAEGGYQVLLKWPEGQPEDEQEGSVPDKLLGWYDAAHTKLTAHVKPGANALPAFQLPARTKPPEAVEGVPGRN